MLRATVLGRIAAVVARTGAGLDVLGAGAAVVRTADVDGAAVLTETRAPVVDGAASDAVVAAAVVAGGVDDTAAATACFLATRCDAGAGLAPGFCAGIELSGATSVTRRSATCRCAPGSASAIPTTTSAHPPATTSAAEVTANRPKLMGPVCQMWQK